MAVIPDGGWRKSSYSGARGDCVEVNGTLVGWHTSPYSGAQGDCVEVNETAVAGAVFLRDTRHRDLATLAFPGREWSAFLNRTVRIWAR
ncbi:MULTISPECIES: DUF397 domain-containing protein [Nocardiopsidaceae]|uniref:DUF397 domain-containing protein n=1 Tax=Streptomonospora nanhaiensis TaxID=1323731 RepID=A0ABY6YJQ6_9ACTN|nr:DUF397 domain-containing protein [Streptomonospora nanhaiensis]WAE72399.1 DUF397 domain-containing protein [Streptomonospora nanhaiensis]